MVPDSETNKHVYLYEHDQSALYSGVLNPHKHSTIDSGESKKQIRKIVKITIYLAIVTTLEVLLGLWHHHEHVLASGVVNAMFLCMTVFKAYLIVDVFMHLGNEIRNFVMAVLIPLTLFSWFIIAFLADGHHFIHMNNTRADTQKIEVFQANE